MWACLYHVLCVFLPWYYGMYYEDKKQNRTKYSTHPKKQSKQKNKNKKQKHVESS